MARPRTLFDSTCLMARSTCTTPSDKLPFPNTLTFPNKPTSDNPTSTRVTFISTIKREEKHKDNDNGQ